MWKILEASTKQIKWQHLAWCSCYDFWRSETTMHLWKQPCTYMGYPLVNESCPVHTLEDLIKEAIDKLDGIGLNVVVIISDMGSDFYSSSLRLKVTADKPWFVHNGKTVYLMLDPPHLLKCIRNNLMNNTFTFGQYSACWKDIEDF